MILGFQVSSSGYSLNGLPCIAPGSMVAPEFIDRAELFLGPTGMLSNMPLYGATGGAVNLVTKKANDKPLTALTTGFLSDGQSATHLDVGRRYGLNCLGPVSPGVSPSNSPRGRWNQPLRCSR